jgi:hypothetical protein
VGALGASGHREWLREVWGSVANAAMGTTPAPGMAQGGLGECGKRGHGHNTSTGALEGGGSRRGGSAAAQL